MGRPTNRSALERTLRELRRMGRLEPVDSASVQALRSMAVALDADPFKAALWREYRAAVKDLRADDDHSSVDEAIADLFAEVPHEASPGA